MMLRCASDFSAARRRFDQFGEACPECVEETRRGMHGKDFIKSGWLVDGRARARLARRRGSALMYLTVTLVALVAFVSLAVDLGRVQLVRGELQLAADAAARHAAAGLSAGVTTAE